MMSSTKCLHFTSFSWSPRFVGFSCLGVYVAKGSLVFQCLAKRNETSMESSGFSKLKTINPASIAEVDASPWASYSSPLAGELAPGGSHWCKLTEMARNQALLYLCWSSSKKRQLWELTIEGHHTSHEHPQQSHRLTHIFASNTFGVCNGKSTNFANQQMQKPASFNLLLATGLCYPSLPRMGRK